MEITGLKGVDWEVRIESDGALFISDGGGELCFCSSTKESIEELSKILMILAAGMDFDI